MTRRASSRVRRRTAAAATTLALLATAGTLTSPPAVASEPDGLYLVTLTGMAESAYAGDLPAHEFRALLRARQDRVLAAIGAPPPVYRWTTALNGFATRLTAAQAADAGRLDGVVSVEPNSVRRLAGAVSGAASGPLAGPAAGDGRGVVIGVIDTGIWPESPLFANASGLGPEPDRFDGSCAEAQEWPADTCNRKLVGARWFVAGFGTDRLNSESLLSARDDNGHGTQVASVAAGNGAVSVRVGRERLGTYAGTAPAARLAVYKACWSAPDPTDDGCATADLVTAIDAAAEDGVDVLTLSVSAPGTFDTVERALLGATEAGAFVAAAAGNRPDTRFAGHPSPWVTTVGAATAPVPGGAVDLGAEVLSGASATRRAVGPAPVVAADRIPAPGSTPEEARLCLPGSLDAAGAAGRIVLCERGRIGRVDKSRTVALADGVGMVLANTRPGAVFADFHSVPTVHLALPAAQLLRDRIAADPSTRVTLAPAGDVGPSRPGVAGFSARGDSQADFVKPDLAVAGVGALGAVPPGPGDVRWNHFSGTSAAAARVSGQAAAVLSRRDWEPARVRSALITSARPLDTRLSALDQGAGAADALAAVSPGLVYDVPAGALRRYLAGGVSGRDLNLPSINVNGPTVVRRTVTSVGRRPMYYSVSATGFDRHGVSITPAAIRIGPGERRTFTVRISGPTDRRVDSGWITWLGADGTTVRIPVVIAD